MLMEHENCPCMETCPLNRAMALIGGKSLDGVSNTVLANALRELEGDGLVHRREYLEVPVRVEYAITEPCRQLIPILDALGDWSMAL